VNVTILGSGSSGNAIVVESASTRILVDAGFSGRDLERRMRMRDIDPESIDALLVTHDHGDHTRGMGVLARRWGTPLYLTEPTRSACAKLLNGSEQVQLYCSDEAVEIGALVVHPFLTVHDAADPIAVTLTERATGEKLGIATDLGRPTATVRHALRGCDLLVLESNHDEVMLQYSPYPWSVKSRIASSHGHLSNRAAAELAVELFHEELKLVVLAHLSEHSNAPGLAQDVVGHALERAGYGGEVLVADQQQPMETIDISRLRRLRQPQQLSLL
jgi:phosphoribosyl 1,2-cyclic phosphodiesterase